MRKVRIALIDSGVDINHSYLYNRQIIGVKLVKQEDQIHIRNSITDNVGHGTAIAGIIFDKCDNVEMLSIKVLNENLRCSYEFLCRALEFAIDSKVDIINLSLGVHQEKNNYELSRLCNLAYEKGILIVSAFSNNQRFSYPAALPKVFGVRSEVFKYKYKYKYIYDSLLKEVYTNGNLQKICWNNNSYKYDKGNSLACGHFTGTLAYFINSLNLTNYSQIEKFIVEKSSSLNCIEKYKINRKNDYSWLNRALICPVNNENIQLLKDPEQLDYTSVGLYDWRCFSKDYFEYDTNGESIKIKIFNSLDEGLENADTLVIGDLNFLSVEHQDNLKKELVTRCLSLGKNILSKDVLLYDEYAEMYSSAKRKKLRIESVYF